MTRSRRRENTSGLLTPAQVADAFNVNPKTVTRWAKTGLIPETAVVWTMGGHRRYSQAFVDNWLKRHGQKDTP